MNMLKTTLVALAVGCAATAALAADPDSDQARQDRMDQAYQDSRNVHPGPAARAESSMKRGVHRAGHAVKNGAEKVGHAIGTGMRKTGAAIDHGGEKMQDSSAPKQ